MSAATEHRKLAAILFTDLVGYSAPSRATSCSRLRVWLELAEMNP
jgi:hypothetical protein